MFYFYKKNVLSSVEQYSKFRSTKFLVHANGIIIFVKIEKKPIKDDERYRKT